MIITEIKKIAVIGCGWLGLPLAKSLKNKGFTINGSTTSLEKIEILSKNGIEAFLVQLNPKIVAEDIQNFLDVDLIIINIPPGRGSNDAESYHQKMQNLSSEILKSPINKLIFISSTSVYPELNQLVDEKLENLSISPSAKRMVESENLFKSLASIDTTIIRMGGLFNELRHPGRFFAGKENIPNGLSPVNLIHLDDCIGIIHHIIDNKLWNNTFNGVAPSHPNKMDFYDLASLKLCQKNAKFISEKRDYKVVDSSEIINSGYQFKHSDLMEWLHEHG